VRYTSPVPRGRRDASPVRGRAACNRQRLGVAPSVSPTGVVLEPAHLASLTPEQREDLRLWAGRVNLLDRVKSYRRLALYTVGAWGFGMFGFAFGVAEAPPLVLCPIVPIAMTVAMARRGASLRLSGLRLRRVLFSRRSHRVLAAAPLPTSRQLRKLATRPVPGEPARRGDPARRRGARDDPRRREEAVEERPPAAPDVVPTVNALVERVANLATTLHRLESDYDPSAASTIEARIAQSERIESSTEELREVALLRRQRVSLEHLARQRVALAHQIEQSLLALGNLRLDLLKLRASGIEAGLADVSSATQEPRRSRATSGWRWRRWGRCEDCELVSW
jgi:hypothetical protein